LADTPYFQKQSCGEGIALELVLFLPENAASICRQERAKKAAVPPPDPETFKIDRSLIPNEKEWTMRLLRKDSEKNRWTMRTALSSLLLFLLLPVAAQGQSSQASAQKAKTPSESLLFPKDFLRGYIDFAVAPPHNEPDLGRCNTFPPTCTAFARYVLSGYVEFQPFGRRPLKHFFAFFEPHAYFGNNIPQKSYTASMQPIALERTIGVGLELPKNFEVRLTGHRVTSFGKFSHSLGPTDSGPDKPLGIYNTISVRWNFGGYGRRTHSW
jgi:hypothetical protein